MGILDTITQLAGEAGGAANTDQAKVAGGFIEALTQHPEGIQGVLSALQANGLGEHVQNWASGQAATATPDQVQQGLGPTGLIEKTAASAGVSPQVVSGALAVILPMVIQHFTNQSAQTGTQTAANDSPLGGLASQILGKFLS